MNRRDFLMLSASAVGAPELVLPAGAVQPDWSHLEARLAQRVRLGYFDGMGLIIGSGDTVLHESYFGNAGPATVMHVASAGKWTAAAAIAAVVDSGALSWEDRAARFLPRLGGDKGQATLRQLLSHTAGYPDYQPAGAPRDSYQTLEEAVSHIAALPAVAAPGAIFQYGGLAMQVAGRIAEIADGRNFPAIFESRLAAPLGMERSGYAPVSQEPGFSPMLGGGLYTSTADFARFLAMLALNGAYRGKRILSAHAVSVLHADQVRGAMVKPMEYVEQARATLHKDIYGLGNWREEVAPNGAANLLSSPGWAGAYPWIDRVYGIWGFVLAKANVDIAVADGYSTFMGSSIYAPMARAALDDAAEIGVHRGRAGQLYYEESGKGQAVILLHGHSFDRRQWGPQVAVLEKQYRVIRYDLRGYGRSPMPQEDTAFLHAEDLRALMDALDVHQAHLVGLSLGGFVVTDFLALYPERVSSAVLAGGDLFDAPGPHDPWTAREIAARRAEIGALKRHGVSRFKRKWFDDLIANSGSGSDGLRAILWQMIDEWPCWQPLHLEPRCLLGRTAPGLLKKVRPAVPVHIIRGDKEKMGFRITEWLPQANVTIIPDCGHVSNLEQVALFNDALEKFLRDARRPTSSRARFPAGEIAN
ncbi:alpha/beta fold hydrolase [Duganella sp. FT92W]|uniref:Alpha/beta fold hydrolase n=1 Tax=Pseudoduganella rivuli TaxID=2666085 RepID=A0A7X2IKB4_9BURK|nr:alpha/beta fold hydrolase [Pseudoduganella rivuli]MRV71592.1 alpha/beta fold hydrolase [Pseudoduganella rivuli]